MSFEVKHKDLFGRVGKLKTKSGTIETPMLLPVVNPRMLEVHPRELLEEFGYKALMTNAYLLKKYFKDDVLKEGVHGFLDYKGVIMTDSGAYQALRYGKVEVEPLEILEFQKRINVDIGVILDVPTGWKTSRSHAEWTVKETLKRAEEAVKHFCCEDKVLWVGPVQGGKYLDLVEVSAKEMAKLPFDIYALGSPTDIMERYLFDILVEMIVRARRNLPIEKPLHLFGAGHPFMFSFAVALGCDLFDSASYALYAKDDRYLTETGTIRLENLEYFTCTCPICQKLTPEELKEKEKTEREKLLMKHNLYVCKKEINRVKQSIVEGRLWELLELRARSHPSLLQALKTLVKYAELFTQETPAYKFRGMFVFDEISLNRPEILTHKKKLMENYEKPREAEILLLLPQTNSKPFHKSGQYKKVRKLLESVKIDFRKIHVCFYSVPFGVIPVEIDDVYPLSQFEVAKPFNLQMKEEVVKTIVEYVNLKKYRKIFLHPDFNLLEEKMIKFLEEKVKIIRTTNEKDPWSLKAIKDLEETLEKVFEKT